MLRCVPLCHVTEKNLMKKIRRSLTLSFIAVIYTIILPLLYAEPAVVPAVTAEATAGVTANTTPAVTAEATAGVTANTPPAVTAEATAGVTANTPPAVTAEATAGVTANTPPAVTVPVIANMVAVEKGPENLKAQVFGMRVNLTWEPVPKSDSAVTYTIYRATGPDEDFIRVNKDDIITNAFVDSKETSIISLMSGITYFYKVAAIINGRESADSNLASAIPEGILAPPDEVTAVSKVSAILLKWAEPESSGKLGLSGFNIFRATEGVMERINQAVVNAFEYPDNNLTNGVKYYYSVQSVDSAGNTSEMSSPVFAMPFSIISEPANVSFTAASSESIRVMWESPSNQGTFGIAGYNIYRSTVPGYFPDKPLNIKLWKEIKGEDGRVFYHDNVVNSENPPAPGFNYFYKVTAMDSAGNTGASSAVASFTIPVLEIKQSGTLSQDISEYGLPPDSRLTLAGKKSLGMSYEYFWYNNPENKSAPGKFDITQKLKLKLNGNIGKRINVDVNYDEELAMQTDEYTKIAISYAGEKEEALQEVSFGDMSLDFPATRYVSYSQTLFGIKGKVKIGDKLSITGIGAQIKGITEIQSFKGNMREKEVNGKRGVDISDVSYSPRVYYYITKEPGVRIRPGSLVIYTDDQNANTFDGNTVKMPNNGGDFDPKYSGIDYIVDYEERVVKFNIAISSSTVIAAGYIQEDGTYVGLNPDGSFDFVNGLTSESRGYTNSSAHLLQNGVSASNNLGDLSHMVVSYYYMSDPLIYNPKLDPDFVIRIESIDGSKIINILRPQDPGVEDQYEIDTDFGILKFKSPFPFAAGQPVVTPPYYNTNGNEADCYNVLDANRRSNYRIHLEYKYYVSSYRLDHSPVVFGSERVELNGAILKKDVDYFIAYETGDISFSENRKKEITSSSDVRIIYEYFPYMQSFSSNLIGGRVDYQLLDNLKLGLTGLYKAVNAGSTLPDARSTETSLATPYSSMVFDGDIKFNVNKETMSAIINSLPGIDNALVPVDYSLDAEMAYSNYNINVFDRLLRNGKTEKGVAMIDSMEGADNEFSASMSKNMWFPASPSYGIIPTSTNRVYFSRKDITEKSHEYQTGQDVLSTDTVNMLQFDFSGASAINQDKWEAFRYVLSQNGESLKQYNYIDMWVYVKVSQPVNMFLDMGIISEDSNGSGKFDYNIKNSNGTITLNESEDYDQNGRLAYADEDSGISNGIYPPNPEYWGKGNTVLDTEDMNNNGRLDNVEAYYQYTHVNDKHKAMTLTGNGTWVNIKIPLKDFTGVVGSVEGNPAAANFMSNIKQLRLSFRGATPSMSSGTIKVESIKFVGNSWQLQYLTNTTDMAGNVINAPDTNKFNLVTINRNVDKSYVPNTDFFDYQAETDKDFEEALDAKFTISNLDQNAAGQPIYYATKSLNNTGSGYDYHDYKYVKMDIFYKKWDPGAGPGKTFFIRLGSGPDPEHNYYQYNQILGQELNNGGWHTLVFAIDGSDDKRSPALDTPNLRSVQYITIGYLNPNSIEADEEIYVNNIRLTDPAQKTGGARYISHSLNYTGFANVTHTYEERDSDFYTLADAGRSDIKQHNRTNRVDVNYNQLPFLSETNSYSKTELFTDEKYAHDPTYTKNDTLSNTFVEAYNNNTGFNLIPDLPISFNASVENANYVYGGANAYLANKRNKLTLRPSFTYRAPQDLFSVIPLGSNNFEGSITWENLKTEYYNGQSSGYYNNWRTDRKQDYKWTGSYTFGFLTLQPSYQQRLFEALGNQSAQFVYYKDILKADDFFYDRDYLVLTREILPVLNINTGDLWIFNPTAGFSSRFFTDYTQSVLNTTGGLWAQTAVKFSSLLPFIPDITSYRVSVDTTSQYNDYAYPGSFKSFEGMPFERKWNAFMWRYLYSEDEVRRIESLAQNGTFVLNHGLQFSEINFFGVTGFQPGGSYSLNRTFSSRGAVRSFSEVYALSANNFHIENVTIPLPFISDFVTKERITANYYYRRTVTRDSNKTVTNDSIENTLDNIALTYKNQDGLNGVLAVTLNWKNTLAGKVRSWNNTVTPRFTMGYNYRQSNPFTIPGWVPFVGDKTIKFEQVINFNLNLNASYTRGGDDSGRQTLPVDVNYYNAVLSASYNVLQNLKVITDLSYSQRDDNLLPINSQKSLRFGVNGEIEF